MLLQCLSRSLPTKCLSRAGVERACDGIQFIGTPPGEVGSLRDVLAQEAVGVFVAAALPWAVQMAK